MDKVTDSILRTIRMVYGHKACTWGTLKDVSWPQSMDSSGLMMSRTVWVILWKVSEFHYMAARVCKIGKLFQAAMVFVHPAEGEGFFQALGPTFPDTSGIDPQETIRLILERYSAGENDLNRTCREVLNNVVYIKHHKGEQLEIEW